MAEITLTINGREVKGEAGDTILRVCQKNSMDVPTLCHFDGMPDMGSCRMCIVEIEGAGRPRISTACTTPATEGMAIRTHTDNLNEMRRNILEFLLSEGNHHCMYCAASGDCELQDLAYQFGIDYIKMPLSASEQPTEVDSSQRYLVSDPNRCILCNRCVRACNDLAGNRVLGVSSRGSKSYIISDLGTQRNDSGCVNCGLCLQVCPTGALIDRRSSYMGREVQVDKTRSTCTFCSVGCGTEIVSRNNYVIRIEGDWFTKPNEGLLCVLGRFAPLYDETRKRAKKPMIRRNGEMAEAGWDEALNLVSQKLREYDVEDIGALASTLAANETLELLASLSRKYGVENIGCIGGPISEPPEKQVDLTDLKNADLFVIAGADLSTDHQVVGFLVKRNLIETGKQMVILNDDETGLIDFANQWMKLDEVEKAIALCRAADNPAIIYADKAGKQVEVMRRELAGKAKFFWMPPGSNSRGAVAAGLGGSFSPEDAKCVYVLACEAKGVSEEMMARLKNSDFVVVQACYTKPWEEIADVILPTAIWAEKEGTITNLEGRELKIAKAVNSSKDVRTEMEILKSLDRLIGL